MNHASISRYQEEGFLVVRGLFTAEEVGNLKEDSRGLALGRFPVAHALSPSMGGIAVDAEETLKELSDDERLRSMVLAHFPQWVSPAFEHVVKHAKLRSVLDALVVAGLDRTEGSAKCLQDYIFCKPPRQPGKAWHQDATYIETDTRSLTGVWIPIDDATIENGCLWFVPGSHAAGELFKMEPHGREDYDNAPVSIGFDDSTEVPVEVAAGDVVFFDGHLLHRSGPNQTDGYRHALVMHWLDVDTPYTWKFPGDPAWPPPSASVTWNFPGQDPIERPLTELESQGRTT